MTVDELASQLFAVAEEKAKSVGRRFGGGADHDLRVMTHHAAVQLLEVEDKAQRRREIVAAKKDLRRLIELALEEIKTLERYPEDLLGEQSYFPAKFRFCPCRPFC
jgi:hypothetical protein